MKWGTSVKDKTTSFSKSIGQSDQFQDKEAATKTQFNGQARGVGRGPNPVYEAGYKTGGKPSNLNKGGAQNSKGPRKPYPAKKTVAQKQPQATRDLKPKGMPSTVKTQSFENFTRGEAKNSQKLTDLFKKIQQEKARGLGEKSQSVLKKVANRSFSR